jgi:integrase
MKRPRGTGCLYQRGEVWWLKYFRNGRPFSESTGTHDKRKAQAILRQRIGEISTGTFLGPQIEKVMVSDLAADLLSDYRANQRRSIGNAEARWRLHLEPFFGAVRAVEVTPPLLTRYAESRLQEAAKPATVNRELALLKRAFNLGRRNQKVRNVPVFPHLQENNIRKGFLRDADYSKLAAECAREGLWLRTILATASNYAWRRSEVLGLQVEQIDLTARTINLNPGETKNDDARIVRLTQESYELLAACIVGKKPTDPVFTRDNGEEVRDFRGSWRNACVRAGVGRWVCRECKVPITGEECTCGANGDDLKYVGLTVHDLRRTGARNLRRLRVDESVIMKIGGWKTPSVFKRYNIVDETDLAEAALKLDEKRAAAISAAEQQPEQLSYSSATVAQKSGQVAQDDVVN